MPSPKKPTKSDIGRMLVGLRHAKLSPERRSEIAAKAAAARWAKKKPKSKAKTKKKPLK